jgi:hypothetical protein
MGTTAARNPFTPKLGVEPPVLVGRDEAMRDFSRLLNGTGKPLLIQGLRGYGKTVLLNHMRDVARPPNEIGGKTQVRVRIIQCHIVQLDKSRVGA